MACMSVRYRVSRQQAASIHRVLFRWGKYLFIVQHSPGRERESDSQNNFSISKLSVWSLMYILHSQFLNRSFLECSPSLGAGCMVWPCMCVRCPSSQLTPNLRQRLVAAWWLMEPLALVHFFIDPSSAKSAPALELDICTIRGDNGAAVIVLPAAALPPHNCSVWCECDEWWQWSDVSRVSTVSSQQPQCHYCDHCPIIICPRVRLKMTTHLAAGNIWCLSSRNELRLLWELDIQTSKARESFYNLVFAEDSRSISIYIDIDCLL